MNKTTRASLCNLARHYLSRFNEKDKTATDYLYLEGFLLEVARRLNSQELSFFHKEINRLRDLQKPE